MQNISNQPPQHSQKVEAATGENEKRFGQNQQQKVYPDLLIYQYLGHDAINQDKSIQIQYPQIENNLSQENQASKSFNNNLKAMQQQSNLKNDSNINQQSYVQQNQAKMSICLQTPNNDSYLQLISTVQLINSTEIKQLKPLNHYQDDKNHQLLPLWVKENIEQKLYLYSQRQLSEIKQLNQNELEISFRNNQGIRQLKFALPIDSDVFFIDSSTLEDKLNENDKAYDKQINSECLTEFALQLLLKETFVKFIKFCNQFDTKFNRVKFLNQLILFGFRDSYNHQQFDLKTFLIFLFAQSINREQSIINPRIKIYDIFSNLQDDDRKRINQASYQLNNCKDWNAIKQLIEEVFLKEATFKQSKDYYKLKNTFQLNKSVKDVFEAKIKSEFEPDLTEIFNQQYMYDSGMTSEDYYDLFIKQTFQIQNENALKYLEKNISLINFLVEKTQIFNTKANENVKETVYSIVSKYFKDKDLVQAQKLLNSKKQIFDNLHVEADKILLCFNFNQKLLQINLEKISKEDFEIFDQILNSQNNDIDVLFQILQRIKVLDLDEKSVMNRILNNITKKIMDQMKQIKQQQEFKQKMENLKQILYKIFICNWNNLNNSQKIKQAIKFEVYRYEFLRQYQQELVEEEKNLFTHFLKVNDIIQNILEIFSQIQNETELSQEKINDLIEKTYQGILIKLNKIEDLQEFSKVLKYLCEDKIKQKIFEKNREQIINSLLERINKLIQLDQILPIEVWNISYILQEQIFELLFNVLTSVKENMKFATNKIYKCVQTIFLNSISLKNTTWNEYKVINEKKERFNNFMKFLSLNQLGRFKEFETFYNDYKQLKCFINLMKKLNVSDIDDKKELLDMIDKDEDLEVKTIQDKFQRIIDKNRDFIGASQYLVDLKLFDEISNKYPLKNKTFEETMHEIYGFALPFIESIYQYLLEQEFPERQLDFKNQQVEQFKQQQPQIQFKNCYKFLQDYFKNQFSLNTESLKLECENLCMICEQSFKSNISPKFFVEFIQQGYHRILDYELLMEIQKTASNFKIVFPKEYQNSFDNLNKLVSQDDLSKQEFFEGSQTIQEDFNTYLSETVQKCNNNQVDRIFLKQQVVPFISSLLNVMDLYSKFKNEVDLQELLFDDDNDLANRIQYYIQIKKYLDEFNKTLNNNILLYIQQVIQFFYKDEKSKEIRQKIEDISKFKDYIQQKLIELGTSQAKNSVKILQLFMKYAKIDINVNDTYLEKNQFEKVQKQDNLQNNSLKQQEDERNYKVTYRTQKRVNNQEKNEDYNEEQIFQIIQRLNIISGQILDEAYKSEEEKEQFKENRKKFEEIYNLIQINLIQTLEKFIQYGYLGGFIKEVEIIIDDKENTIDTVIKNIKSIVDEKENQIKQWIDVVKEAQQRYQFMKLIIPKCYPDLFRYFQYLLNVKVNQDSKITTKNSVTIKEQQFQQSNPKIQFNMEEMISFYYMNTNSLANQLRVDKNLIKLDTIHEKISLIGDYLNQLFERGQNTLKFSSNKTGFLNKPYQKLVAKKIQCESYGDMCKQLLNYFGNQDKPDKLQFLFANQQTTEMDIEAFLNRVIYFEMGNEKLRNFFIIDFKKLKYQVQKFAIEQIDRYMNIDDPDSQLKTKNELIILYLFNQDMHSSQDQDDENTEEDCIRIPLTEEFKKKTPQYENRNIHLFQSDIAGVGKTFQIQKKIRQSKQPQQLLINIPAHQFQNIDNLLKILRSKKKEMQKQNQDQIHGIHIEIIYDQQDKISLLLFQILVLKCISYNQNKFFNFCPKSQFYIEQSNYYNIPYAKILTHIKSIETQKVQFDLSQLSVSNQFTSDDQIMLRYLHGLTQGEQYFMEKDFVRFDAFRNQKLVSEKIFTDNEAQQLIGRFIEEYKQKNKIKQKLTYQSVVMFRQQFVTQIKEMELDPNYTCYQISQYMQNASPEQKENIRQLRYNIIYIFLEQSLKNTFLNTSIQSQTSKNYYENYMQKVQEEIENKSNKKPKSKKQSQLKISEWNQKKRQSEQQQDTFNTQPQQQQKQQPISICQYLTRLLNCFKIHSQFQINQNLQPTQPRLQESEIKYLMNMEVEDKINHKQIISHQIVNIKLSDEEQRIQEMNKIPQYDQAIKNLIFFINGGIIAAIFKDDRDDQRILKLEQLMSTFIQQVNNISTFKVNVDEELQLRIPHIGSTEDEYILIRTLLYICSKNPSKFIDEQVQKQKPELSKILQEKAFTKDNTCKLIQIAFKIYSGVPLVIMGETGIGKTVNIQILSEIMGFKFEVLRLSAGTTIDQIIRFMKDIKNKYDADTKIVIFFDEINTNQNIYGLLKEIFTEKTMNGKRINKNNQNIVCIAACNPYEYIQKKEKNDFEAGLLTRFQLEKAQKANLTYHVYPLPESMLPFVVNYGQLEEKVEEKNIYQMLNKINFRSKLRQQNQFEMDKKKEFDHTINIFSEEELKCIQQLIMTSQQFVRCKQKSSRSASLRDVSRTIKFIEFFMKDYFLKRGDKDTETQKQKSVILSLYLCYQIRLNSQKQREEYQEVVQHIQSKYAFFSNVNQSSFFDKTINEELDYFINQLKIDSKLISKNKALKENCFCIALCILTKVPLFITGEPGTSKTLSFALVINSFKGISSSSQFLQGFPSIKEFYIQGNLQTQSEEIRKAFQQAKDAQEKGILPVVFFDEAGQAELSENNPNKVLHELLDEGDVSFIASSNYSLDYAKQNRCLHLQRNKNSLEDLKDFVNQLVNQNTQLKSVLNDFCHVYYNFHDSLKNYIHNSRDFYYTIKYCCSIVTKNPSKYLNERDIVLLLYKATIKNFSGYNKNTSLIRDEFLKQFSKYKEQIQEFELNTQEIIEECFKPICEDFVYHSRFPMLITDNTDQAIEFAKMQLEKNGLQSQVKTGSHFKKDFYEDKTREISSINASIEQNYSIISVNQDYIYAVYYDFFTMNFSRIGDKQKFRLNYKQIQTRIEVPQNYLFIMIVTKDQYMKMDLALLNRFEKHIFSQKLVFQRQEDTALKSILNEFKMIKSLFQKDKHFLSFVKKSYISGMVQVEFKKLEQSDEDLKNKCIDLIGNLSKKYDIVRLRKQNPNGHFQAWNQKTYLDNLIEFVKQQKIKSLSSQNLAFYSIVYTHSYLYSNYEALLKENGFETLLIDLSQIKQKFEFEQYAEDYYKKNYNLMIVRISCQDENRQNIYFIRSYLDDCRLKYQQKFQKSIIILIQNSDSSHYRLPFCMKWDQFQIDNLLPYAYTQSSLKEQEIQEINKILNYRYIHGRNEREILENKKIFNYFTQMQGFCSKLIQRMTFRFEPDKEQFYQYYEKIRKILEDHFKNQESIVKNHFYEYFVEHLKLNSNQDDLWSYRYDLIKGQNYEKQMINFLKNKVESVILTILSQYEDLNLLINIDKIKNLGLNHQNLYMAVFQKYVKQAIVISDGSEIKRIPYMNIQYIFSNIIYNKIENTKDKYEQYDAQKYKNYISLELKIFQDIFNADNFNNYIEDFLFYKDIKRNMYQDEENKNYASFCEKLLVELNKKNCFHDCYNIHEILWNNEKIFTEILELISIFNDLKNANDLAIFLVNQGVFTNKKDILENASEFYYQALLNMKQAIEKKYIEHFIKIFPSQNSSLRFQIISQCYQSYLKYDNFINIKELLIIFKDIKSELIATQLQSQYFKKLCYSSLCITTFGILNNNKVDIDPCFEHIMIEIIYFFNQNQPNDYLQADINLIISYFFKNIQEQINQNFLKLFNAILNKHTNQIIFNKQYLENLDKILKTHEVKTEDKFTQLLIRIGEITFQKEELIYTLNPNLVISNFKEYEKTGQATVQFIFTSIYFRLIAPEIANMIKEGYEKDVLKNRKFDLNQINQFLISLSQNQSQIQLNEQYLQIYLLKLISNENSDFFKKMNNCKQQKTTQFLFIDMFKKIYEQNDFDPYEFPWCDENYINKIEKLDKYKYNFLVLATLKLMKKNVDDSYFTKWQKDVFDKTQNLKDQSSLAKFIIYLASQMLEKNNQSNQLNQFIQPQSNLYITSIYVPFNSITKQQLQAHEIQTVLASVSDKKKVYQCACGFVYAVGNCGQNMVTVNCKNCNKQIGGKNHVNIDQEYKNQIVQDIKGIINQFLEDKYLTPRLIDPLAFRFGNLIIYSLVFISEDKKLMEEKYCIEIMTKQWKIIKDLLKQTDEYLLIVSLQLFNKLIQLDSKNFTDINNRDQFEQNFSNFCKQFPTKIEEIKKNFDNKNSTQRDQQQQYVQLQKLLREQDKNALFLNTLQYYQLPLQSELEGQYLHKGYKYKLIIQTRESISKIKLVYPLIFFYKKIHQMYSNRLTKKFSEQQTLSKILENKPYLLKYYEENVIKSWNKLRDFFPEIVIGCKPQPTQLLGSAQNTFLESFLITKKQNQTQAIPSDQLFFFITEVTQIQNTVLKEISNEVRQQKNIFDLYDDDLIAISDNLNLENLIYFDNLQLVVNQQKKNFNTEQLKNYYFFDQLFTKNQILDFQENNYFILKKDTTNLGNIYSNKILQDDKQQIQRLKQNMKERFLKLCHQQEQQFEVREQLFFLHDFMKNLPQDKIQGCLENSLYSELEKYGFIIDESYFKECLRQFQVYHIFDLLVILETELMDELVQNLEQTYKVILPDEQFVKFIEEFKLKVLDKLNKKLSASQNPYENEVNNKSNKDLQLVLGRYIIRNLQSCKYLPNFIESNIFESINYFYDQQFLDPLLQNGEDDVKFEDLNIKHKYIYNLYERLALDYKQQLDLQQKIIQQQKQEVSKNINNQQMQIFGFGMDKRELNGHLHNLNAPIPQNYKQLIDDNDNDQNDDAV